MSSGIPDALWLERAKRRLKLERAEKSCHWWDHDEFLRYHCAHLRAEIAEINETALRWYPGQAVGHRKLAQVYWLLYDATGTEVNLARCIRSLKTAIRLEPGNWLHYRNLGVAREASGELLQALTAYSEALRLCDRDDERTWLQGKCRELASSADALQPTLSVAERAAPARDVQGGSSTPARPVHIDRHYVEGLLRAGWQIEVTRDPNLREDALASHEHICMMCGLDPYQVYPSDYALAALEVHHITPLSSGGLSATRLNEVLILCGSCHEVVHAWIRQGGDPSAALRSSLWRGKDAPRDP